MKDVTAQTVCVPVPADQVDLVWDKVAPMLQGAVHTARGKCTLDDVRGSIADGLYLLWVVMDEEEIIAAITSRIIDYPQCKGMALDWIGGRRMKEWLPMAVETMATHARHNGCTHLEGYGRMAWLRWTQRYGWKEDYTAFRMEV